MISQPPPELWQDIKDITFHTNGIVEWSEVNNGKMTEMIGRYIIQSNSRSMRGLPFVFIAPTNYPDPRMSSIYLLILNEVEIDYDCRFHIQLHGKALKAKTQSGKSLVFLKKKESANKLLENIGTNAPNSQH